MVPEGEAGVCLQGVARELPQGLVLLGSNSKISLRRPGAETKKQRGLSHENSLASPFLYKQMSGGQIRVWVISIG